MSNQNELIERLTIAPNCSRFLFISGLPHNLKDHEYYDLFSPYGSITQIRKANSKNTAGTAIVVFDDVLYAHRASKHLNGFQLKGKYIRISTYYKPKGKIGTEKE